ncbi:MAG TPA: DUF488 domain-containing protein [Candidatus Binatia bacterium]|nr:DUF488 domain-containing protein [Candidatus Binatia bacterium]
MEVWTIGHSTRQFDTFVDILRKHRIETIIDVRHFPASQRMPWFKKEYLELLLPKYRINYVWMGKSLGGYRKGGFEAHKNTKEFLLGMQQLMDTALSSKSAIMCAESVFFRCHRRYIADELSKQGWTVNHIYDENRVERHETIS